MTTTAMGGGDRTASLDKARAASDAGGLWARHLWGWLTGTGYRPERRYMRGGRTPAAGARP
jgi:hypothetical protein